MKKIVPFKKEIIFKTNLAEITSISLEHSLKKQDEHLIAGAFSLNGEYKITDASTNTEIFSYELPFDIHMDERYILDNCTVDIDDFYYEIVNENVLSVNIDVKVDKLSEKPLIEKTEEPVFERVLPPQEIQVSLEDVKKELEKEEVERKEKEVEMMKTEVIEEQKDIEPKENASLFGSLEESETYMTYRVYIVREGDSIENILTRYEITREELASYNDLSEVKLGDKLIIPAIYHEASE